MKTYLYFTSLKMEKDLQETQETPYFKQDSINMKSKSNNKLNNKKAFNTSFEIEDSSNNKSKSKKSFYTNSVKASSNKESNVLIGNNYNNSQTKQVNMHNNSNNKFNDYNENTSLLDKKSSTTKFTLQNNFNKDNNNNSITNPYYDYINPDAPNIKELNHELNEINNNNKNFPQSSNFFNQTTKENTVISSLHNNNSNNNNNEEDIHESYSFKNLIISILVIGGSIIFAQVASLIRYSMLFIFVRKDGIEEVAAVSTVTSVYSIITFGTSWALTQGYGFKCSEYFAAKEYIKLGRLTNKAYFLNLVIGVFLGLFLALTIAPIFSLLIDDAKTIKNIDILYKILALSTPFQFLQMVLTRYYLAINNTIALVISVIFSVIVQLVFSFILVNGFGWVSSGIATSFVLGTLACSLYLEISYRYFNPYPDMLLPFDFSDIKKGFWAFIKYSFPLFILLFLTSISFDFLPFLTFLISKEAYPVYGVILNLLSFSYIFAEAIAAGNNVLLNKAIGEKVQQYFLKIIMSTVLIITIYLIIAFFVLLFFYNVLISAFTTVESVKQDTSDMKFWFMICLIVFSYQALIAESLTAMGDENFPIITLIIGRFLLTAGFSVLFAKGFKWGNNSVIIALNIGQLMVLVANIFRLYYILRRDRDFAHDSSFDNGSKNDINMENVNPENEDNENNENDYDVHNAGNNENAEDDEFSTNTETNKSIKNN